MRAQPSGAANASPMASSVALRFSSFGERAERGVDRAPSVAVETRSTRVEHDVALGERARLVEADDVDPGQPLDRGQLLHEHLAAGQRHRGDAEREAREQDEALGDHADDGGDHRDERLGDAVVLAPAGAAGARSATGNSAYWM